MSEEFKNEIIADVFGRDALAERHQFRMRTRNGDDQQQEEETATETEQQAAADSPAAPTS